MDETSELTEAEREQLAAGIPMWQIEASRAEAEQAPCERRGPF